MKAYILAKNEENNIGRCLKALIENGVEPIVLDSGSTDNTKKMAAEYGAEVRSYCYRDHCASYNEITTKIVDVEWCLILDADMIVSSALLESIRENMSRCEVVIAPIDMHYEGRPLRYASLYPPKPIAFKRGKAYFHPVGHGERLKPGVNAVIVKEKLVHDDRKPLIRFLTNQVRYAEALIRRKANGQITWKDWIRVNTPLSIFLVPFIILFVKLGILDGRAGVIYALDRMIAEVLKFRQSLINELKCDD